LAREDKVMKGGKSIVKAKRKIIKTPTSKMVGVLYFAEIIRVITFLIRGLKLNIYT
jgi:hypothetical protein